MSYFQESELWFRGKSYRISIEEGRAHEGGSSYWHHSGSPSTWLAIDIFWLARRKLGSASDAAALKLAARALCITVQGLRDAIRWHEAYIRFHDGDPDYKILDE